jgi:hypothetical protein
MVFGEPAHITICSLCYAVVLSTRKCQEGHRDYHKNHLEHHQLLQQTVDAALPR